MNDQSPPKRVTRARAAAKTDTGIKTTKIATASSKAKITRATSTKRKTRSDDIHEDEELQQPQEIIEPEPETKTTRGRAKKAVEPEPEMEASAPARATRGRPKRTVAEAPAAEPVRSLRGRPKKTDLPEESVVVEELPKRPTRGRAAAATTVNKPVAPRKTVKFEEPDKENILPAAIDAKGKGKSAEVGTGLRAKPVRKPATTRATRGRKAVEEEPKPSPLSPKKATQVATAKESVSEDELATTEKTPMKPLMKSPVKPPGSVFGTAKKLDFSTSVSVYHANVSTTQNLKGSVISSPARRPPQSPFKEAMKTSPNRVPLGGNLLQSPFKPSFAAPQSSIGDSSFKASLLQSPARRPQSPTKVSEEGSPTRGNSKASIFDATPKVSTFKISRFATPRTLTKSINRPGQMLPPALPEHVSTESPLASKDSMDTTNINEPTLKFSGRLSSVMPRDTDLAFATSEPIAEEASPESAPEPEQAGEAMEVDQVDTIVVEAPVEAQSTTPPASPPRNNAGPFSLREVDDNPFDDSDSEDELASGSPMYSPLPMNGLKMSSLNFPSSPDPFSSINKTPKFGTTHKIRAEHRDKIGFTPLAKQLSDWMGASPDKSESRSGNSAETSPISNQGDQEREADDISPVEASPAKSTYFEDEMAIRDELASAVEQPEEQNYIDVGFEPVQLDEEDLALANEADEMSLLEPDQIQTPPMEEMFTAEDLAQEDELLANLEQSTPSEASEEYGDENAVVIDPELLNISALQAEPAPRLFTPKRILSERTFHTVAKVPLKPAAEETPMRPFPIKRSASISKLPVQRPTALGRSNTVISYSPNKSTPRSQHKKPAQDVEVQDFATPSKPNSMWSTMGTPARTPRRDLDTALLKGAVVFVDVHTTEGADASVLFTELLTQMGARCVKSWNWNGNGEDGSKIGITHVIFKDGGKRTLERVKQAGGVVSCVGVGWVLDCERENKWLDEAPYVVDSGIIPRGGSRRRKSMEPRALANLNGTLVPSSSATPSRNFSPSKDLFSIGGTPVTSKSRRRDSVQWMHTPTTSSPDNTDDQTLMLSPVPVTPAPETISAYAEDGLFGETPGGQTPYFLHKEQLVQKTAPVKRYFETEQPDDEDMGTFGKGFLSEKKDESVMMRLMAARRKSLQWAPKVGSPLAKGAF